jgi:uncharacterized protein YuzE
MGITYVDDTTATLEDRDYRKLDEQENAICVEPDETCESWKLNREYEWQIKPNETQFEHAIGDRKPILVFMRHVFNLIFNKMHFPESWKSEGVAPPNIAAKSKAFKRCNLSYKDFEVIPYIVTPTIEEGVYIEYDKNGKIALEIEVFNDLNVVAIVSNYKTKQILCSEEIRGLNFSNVIIWF